MNCVDLECGGGLGSSAVNNYDEDNICVSEAREGSCFSSSYSTASSSIDGSNIDSETESDQIMDSSRVSSVVGSDCVIDIDKGVLEDTNFSETGDRDCRICNLSLEDKEYGIGIELGCSCKDDLAGVHENCADTWFKIKGNNICEICHSVAENVVLPSESESSWPAGVITAETIDPEAWQQITAAANALTRNAAAVQESANLEIRSFLQLIVMVLAIGIVLLFIIIT